MKVVPAIDILSGVVVRGVGGRRSEYKPIQSLLTSNPAPQAVIDALASRYGFEEFYVAELDGLKDDRPNLDLVSTLVSPSRRLIVDVGTASAEQASLLAECGVHRVVAASESLPSIGELKRMIERLGAERIVFSMDLKHGRPIVLAKEWQTRLPEEIVETIAELGIRQFILLDLADVGESRGTSTLPILERLRRRLPSGWFAVGGGVRNREDFKAAEQAGADALLIASALHDGSYPFA